MRYCIRLLAYWYQLAGHARIYGHVSQLFDACSFIWKMNTLFLEYYDVNTIKDTFTRILMMTICDTLNSNVTVECHILYSIHTLVVMQSQCLMATWILATRANAKLAYAAKRRTIIVIIISIMIELHFLIYLFKDSI